MDMDLNTLLVALMFVTILCMGIGNILVSLGDIFNHASPSRRDKTHVGWIFFTLLIHFNLFWHTKEILAAENWQFGGFLLAIAGPVLLFFSTCILLTEPPNDVSPDRPTFFLNLGRRFFLMFAVVQGWILFISFTLTGSFVLLDTINMVLMAIALILASTKNTRTHNVSAWLAWGLVLVSGVFRWIGS